jgi:hypothetical protein
MQNRPLLPILIPTPLFNSCPVHSRGDHKAALLREGIPVYKIIPARENADL